MYSFDTLQLLTYVQNPHIKGSWDALIAFAENISKPNLSLTREAILNNKRQLLEHADTFAQLLAVKRGFSQAPLDDAVHAFLEPFIKALDTQLDTLLKRAPTQNVTPVRKAFAAFCNSNLVGLAA